MIITKSAFIGQQKRSVAHRNGATSGPLDVSAWKRSGESTESPFSQFVAASTPSFPEIQMRGNSTRLVWDTPKKEERDYAFETCTKNQRLK